MHAKRPAFGIGMSLDVFFFDFADSLGLFPETDQPPIKRAQHLMVSRLGQFMVQFATEKGLLSLWIGDFLGPTEAGEFFPPPFTNRLHEFFVGVTDEILERRRFAIFFSHEEQRNER